jgi:L-asparagine transporter-like permease
MPLIASQLIVTLLAIAIGCAVTLATIKIETIVFAGPTLSVPALPVALGWRTLAGAWMVPLLAISIPLISFCIFALINVESWNPQEAYRPVTAILLLYQCLAGMASIAATYQLRNPGPKTTLRSQFTIRAILILTAAVAIILAVVRIAMNLGATSRTVLAIALALTTLVCIAAVAAKTPAQPHAER